jgi:protein-disulfide isomerase
MPPKQRPNRVSVPRASTRPSRPLLLGLIGAAMTVAAVGIVLSVTLTGGDKKAAPTTIFTDTLGVVAGIPENGLVLGNPKAKVTLTEYIDTSCPICKDYVLTTFPSVVKRYVRSGKIKIEASVLGSVGPSSARGRELLLAAAQQDKAWQFAEVLYRNQGDETTAWLTDDVARALAAKVHGLNVATLFAQDASTVISNEAAATDAQAQADGATATPTFILTTPDGKRHFLGSGNPGFEAFVKVLDRALKA